jgi:hypothetical protein
MGTGKPMIPVLLLDLEFLNRMRRLHHGNFKSAALAAGSQSECQILNSAGISFLQVVLDSNIGKAVRCNGMRMSEPDHLCVEKTRRNAALSSRQRVRVKLNER